MLDIVIAEDDERPIQTLDQLAERRLAAWARDEVPGDHDEVGAPRRHPADGALDGVPAAGRQSEVEVGQVRDAQPRELGRQPRKWNVEPAKSHPARLEPAPTDSGAGSPAQQGSGT